MGIPIGQWYRVTLHERALKEVRCEKCSQSYEYLVERKAQGQGESLLWLDNAGAQRRAELRARDAVAKKLAEAVDPAACPACGWYQLAMVREARRRRGRWFLIPAGVIGGIGAFVGFIAFAFDAGSSDPLVSKATAPYWSFALGAVALAVAVLVVRHFVCMRWDVNGDTLWKRRRRAEEEGKVIRRSECDVLESRDAAVRPDAQSS